MATFQDIIQSPQPVLIDFSAEWCGPCKALAPVLHEVAGRLDGQAKVIKIDVDRNPELSAQLQIQSVPTLMVFKDGQALWRQSGLMSAAQLEAVVRSFV